LCSSNHRKRERDLQLGWSHGLQLDDVEAWCDVCACACAGPGHQDVEGGQSLPEEQRIAFWNDVNVPRNIKERLSGALTDVYIQLDNLSKFVELNYDGFR